MAGEFDQAVDEIDRSSHHQIVWIPFALAYLMLLQFITVVPPDGVRQTAGYILAQAEHLAHFADGTARAIMNDGCGQRGAARAIALIDILNDFLTPLMLEIHINVRRFAALGIEKAFEQDIDFGGIDRGHIQCEANYGIGGGSAPLTKNFLAPRKGDDIADGKKVMRDFAVGDEAQLHFGEFCDM